ncbi:hypothetical protein Ndes2437B_g08757 [Nannochloris sp. 'desiccata']
MSIAAAQGRAKQGCESAAFMDPAQQAEAAAQPVAPQFTAQPEVAQQVQAPAVAQAGIAAQQVDAEMSQA